MYWDYRYYYDGLPHSLRRESGTLIMVWLQNCCIHIMALVVFISDCSSPEIDPIGTRSLSTQTVWTLLAASVISDPSERLALLPFCPFHDLCRHGGCVSLHMCVLHANYAITCCTDGKNSHISILQKVNWHNCQFGIVHICHCHYGSSQASRQPSWHVIPGCPHCVCLYNMYHWLAVSTVIVSWTSCLKPLLMQWGRLQFPGPSPMRFCVL